MSAQRDAATVPFKLATSTTHRWMLELIVMEGNQAGKAGDFIFGGCLDSCYLATHSLQHKMILTLKIFVGYNYHCLSEDSVSQFRRETFHLLAMTVGEYGYVYIICTYMYCDSDSIW